MCNLPPISSISIETSGILGASAQESERTLATALMCESLPGSTPFPICPRLSLPLHVSTSERLHVLTDESSIAGWMLCFVVPPYLVPVDASEAEQRRGLVRFSLFLYCFSLFFTVFCCIFTVFHCFSLAQVQCVGGEEK